MQYHSESSRYRCEKLPMYANKTSTIMKIICSCEAGQVVKMKCLSHKVIITFGNQIEVRATKAYN